MTDLVTPISDERLTFTQEGEHGNCVISPENGQGPYFTLIGGGSDEEQNALAAKICDAVNALRARGVASLEASPAPVSGEMVEASCPGCQGTGDQGGNPSYGVCDDCNGTGKVNQPLPAALAAKGGQ